MSWHAPTHTDLIASLSDAELSDIGDKGAAFGQDATTQIILRTADTVRGFVRRTGVVMGPAGTIPGELLAACMDIAAVDIFIRLGVTPTKDRSERARDARALLADMARGEGIAPAGHADAPGQAGLASPSFTDRRRTAGRDYESGL